MKLTPLMTMHAGLKEPVSAGEGSNGRVMGNAVEYRIFEATAD